MAKPITMIISCRLDGDELRKRIYDYAMQMGWTVVKDVDEEFKIRTGFTWWTWGELITISQTGSETKIESRCSPNVQLFDWGKNQGNVNMFKYVLSQANGET